MALEKGKITSLSSLDREIYRLQLHARALEEEIDGKFNHLQENYSSMMIKSMLPAIQRKTGIPSGVLQVLAQNQRLQDVFGTLAERLVDKVADGVEFLSEKLASPKG